ncbi:CHAT domain-containing protein [Jatrophihabitans sp. DSM 45814]
MAATEPGPDSSVGPNQLLALALSRPNEAAELARKLLASRPSAYDASIARQTVAIVLRDRGDVAAAIKELRSALELAEASGRSEREADVLATLGVALAWTGHSSQGLALLDRAAGQARGVLAGTVLMRRASVLRSLGRYQEALDDLNRALALLRRGKDSVWEARSLTHRAEIYLAFGDTDRAGADYQSAEVLFASADQELEYAKARHNRGRVAFAHGDLPAALTYLDEAGHRYVALDAVNPDLAMDRCAALLAAGLADDAVREADTAAAELGRRGGDALRTADLVFAAAYAALAASDPQAARLRAERARRSFKRQGRALWQARAELVVIRARYLAGESSSTLLRRAEQIARQLEDFRDSDAPQAHLVAGRLAVRRGDKLRAERHFASVAGLRRRGSSLTRSLGWLGQALHAEVLGNNRAMLTACGRGLDALDEYRRTLGATELRAHATSHGAELALIAQRQALGGQDVRRLLLWSERWRATALGLSPPIPPTDQELVGELSSLRAVTWSLDAARADGLPTTTLDRERRRLEHVVRSHTLRSVGSMASQTYRLDLEDLFDALGETRMVELIEIDGTLHAITIAGRKLRRHALGAVPAYDAFMARSVLGRFAAGQPIPHAQELLGQVGARLERVLLGASVADLGAGPVVVVPPGPLHAVPWALLPSLRDRVLSVAPSASAWLRAMRTAPPDNRRVSLIVGPGLATGGAEVPALAEQYPGATVLRNGTATAERALAALDGAWLAHIAAHGTFRADNPLFSAVGLDDGPLTVHDFERLQRAPYRIVLSSCDSAVAAPVGANELIGLSSSLIPLGAVGILASVVPVNDQAVVPMMLALHQALQHGDTLPEALHKARAATDGDPIGLATGLSFTALGA